MDSVPRPARPLELWGGIECTHNRVGDHTLDQLDRTGHSARIDDLDCIAALGLRTLRYPLLWERIAPDGVERADWSWADARMARLRLLGIEPIAGLLHHGSGPLHTSLLDPTFPEQMARYAGAVAARYPWVRKYTPVNEPLSTARFSGLYGHWYPHARDTRTWAYILLNECRAVVLAMEAIRRVNPAAELVQTEDLGKTHSTPALRYQADFENERRWLTFDLLCGRVDSRHSLWRFFRANGVEEDRIAWFLEHPCPPNLLGINYYITSERFLDERLALYPAHTHGGNGKDSYADVEAVRVLADPPAGLTTLLGEAWRRYGLRMAITEAHLGDSVDEQQRWLWEIWQAARAQARAGVAVEALTVWSLLGAYDWDSLVTMDRGHYEPGVFDVRSGTPRPTPLARLVRELARGRTPRKGLPTGEGWWRRPGRLLYPPVAASDGMAGMAQ